MEDVLQNDNLNDVDEDFNKVDEEIMVTAEDIVEVPKGRGREAEIVKESTMLALIRTSPTGLLKYVNGRPSDMSSMDGPNSLGGVYAITINRGITNIDGLNNFIEEFMAKSCGPSVHGDDHPHPSPVGYAFFKLWSLGKLEGVKPPNFDSQEELAAVLEANGDTITEVLKRIRDTQDNDDCDKHDMKMNEMNDCVMSEKILIVRKRRRKKK